MQGIESPELRVILLAANYTIAVIGRANSLAQAASMKERALDNIRKFFVRWKSACSLQAAS